MKLNWLAWLFFILINSFCKGQNVTYDSKQFISFLKDTQKGVTKFNKNENKVSKKYYKKYLRAENKLNRKLCKIDPELADYLFSYSQDPLYYRSNNENISQRHSLEKSPKIYNPTMDTLNNVFEYYELNKDSLGICNSYQINSGRESLKLLGENTSEANNFQKYLRERKVILTETLSKYPSLNNEVVKFDKVNYYFIEISSNNKRNLNDRIKSNDFYNEFVSNNVDLKKFMDLNSRLASILEIPTSWGKSVCGLQKNSLVSNTIAKTIASQPGGLMDIVKKEVAPMHESIKKLKASSNLTNLADVPSFKPNELKTKSTLEKVHCGVDFQVDKSLWFYPCQISLNGKVGFQLTNRLTSGIGLSYSISLGESWNKRDFYNLNERSFLYFDYRILKNIYFDSSVEKDLKRKQVSKEVKGIRVDLFDSILAGIKLKRKVSKKHSMTFSMLYDFQSSNQSRIKSPFVYRFGWEY